MDLRQLIMADNKFDYESIGEEEEQLDYNKLSACPHCKKPIPFDSLLCLYCGQSLSSFSKKSWVVIAAIIFLAIFVIFILNW